MFALTLAIPLLAVIGYFGYRFVNAPRETVSEASVSPALTRSTLDAALRKAGVEPRRMRSEEGHLVVETPLEATELSSRLRKYLTDTTVEQNGSEITIQDGARREMLRVVPLKTVNSDAGLVEADEETTPPEEKVPRKVAAVRHGVKNIVLVIDDIGFAGQPIAEIASIDANLNAAVIPGTPHATQSAEQLASRGFEILCHLPMEPIDFPRMRPGDDAIMTSMTDSEIEAMTLRDLSSIPHARGFNNHMGSRATTDPRVMRAVLSVASKQGFFYLDSKTTPRSIGENVARRMGVPTAGRDVFLDDNESERAVRRQLAALVERSENTGLAIGIGHPYPATVRVLREEIPRLRAQGFKFLHVSEVVR